MHHIERVAMAQQPARRVGEGRHVLQQLFLRHELGRPGIEVQHAHARAHIDSRRQRAVVAAGHHFDMVAGRGEAACDMRNVDVLAAGIHPAGQRQR